MSSIWKIRLKLLSLETGIVLRLTPYQELEILTIENSNAIVANKIQNYCNSCKKCDLSLDPFLTNCNFE